MEGELIVKKNNGMTSRSDIHENLFNYDLNALGEHITAREKDKKETFSKKKKDEIQKEIDRLNEFHQGMKKESRVKEYMRKADKLAERFPEGAFFIQENKTARNTYLTKEQSIIYCVLIKLATIHKSWVNVWCNEGIENYGSKGIVELYEYIKENIYMSAGISEWGRCPYIDQWLQMLDVCLDYTMSKRVCNIVDKLELMRKEGLGINHQINYGSIVCQDGPDTYYARAPYGPVPSAVPKAVEPMDYENFVTEEQFFSGVEVLTDCYLETIKIRSGEALKDGIQIGRDIKSINEGDDPDYYDEDEILPFPEYKQRTINLIKYVKSDSEVAKKVLKDEEVTIEQAIDFLEYLPS